MTPRRVKRIEGWRRAGPAFAPRTVLAEDFSRLIRFPRPFRLTGSRVRTLH